MTIKGPAIDILQRERIALNVLARLSGIATRARTCLELVGGMPEFKGRLAGTRKTTPGFRLWEKYALQVGGVDTHRENLSSSIVMLKDNHIDGFRRQKRLETAGGNQIVEMIQRAKARMSFGQRLEVECRSEIEAIEMASSGVDIVMLDNFSANQVALTSKQIKEHTPHVLVEVSGGITKDNLQSFAISTVDVISMGYLTQGYPSIDFSLRVIVDFHENKDL